MNTRRLDRLASHPLRLAIAGLGGAAGLGTTVVPAAAQYYAPYYYNAPPPAYAAPYGRPAYGPEAYAPGPRPIRPRAIVDRLDEQGYDDIGRPRFTGTLYLVEATAPNGARVQVTVDAIRGVVLNQVALGAGRRLGAREDDLDDDRRGRFGGRPPPPPAGVAPYAGPGAPGPLPGERREATRDPNAPLRGERGLPADPRLAPGGEPPAAARPVEPRTAVRTTPPTPRATPEPAAPKGTPAPDSPRVSGTNPDARGSKPVDARTPSARPDTAAPPTAPSPPREAQQRTNRPVRVIDGVTPPNSGGGTAPAPAKPADDPLTSQPLPPAAEPATGIN